MVTLSLIMNAVLAMYMLMNCALSVQVSRNALNVKMAIMQMTVYAMIALNFMVPQQPNATKTKFLNV